MFIPDRARGQEGAVVRRGCRECLPSSSHSSAAREDAASTGWRPASCGMLGALCRAERDKLGMFGWGCWGLSIFCLLAQLEEHLLFTLLLVQLILQGLKHKETHTTGDVFEIVLELWTLSPPTSQAGHPAHAKEALPSSVASACPATPSCAGCGSHPGT